MLITVLIVIFALIALYLGWYLLAHRNRSFLVFKPQNTPSLSHVLIFWGTELILIGVLSLVAAVLGILMFTVIILIIGCFSGTLMALTLMTYMH
ncbi:hypothetical protein LOOC260_115690 [Paucilactobacillus hokkaidonensis JCM 18461]|uniref:Uncharacterized protein n=2 Tax=Paucilactobacillus hokkaidonensis TaxID=1193095 RepID=A0A0A1GYM4_9LACO|nr:hypothetical protein [Paucilactobacillus hokkaidonensis]KRO10559.1 hypothetical protein IV59_GL001657 [Paucilactobacillus hokkaidonensis]BAP86079.1 hypothetical protein LOOC260_115690 [Paucilactobacillus hokkaidonensis JCM 18461]